MVRDDLRLCFHEGGKLLFQCLGDPAMQRLARTTQQSAVGGVLNQRVLEQIFRRWCRPRRPSPDGEVGATDIEQASFGHTRAAAVTVNEYERHETQSPEEFSSSASCSCFCSRSGASGPADRHDPNAPAVPMVIFTLRSFSKPDGIPDGDYSIQHKVKGGSRNA